MIVLWYLILIALLVVSYLAIRRNEWLGRQMEYLFGLKEGSFYKTKQSHSMLVRAMQWPMFLGLIGLIVPTPLIWDAILGFALGMAYQFYRWSKAKADDVDKSASPRAKTA